jgi:hypothetical protein
MQKQFLWGGVLSALVLALATGPAGAAAGDLDFTLTNKSTYTIKEFYTSPATMEGWGDNALGGVLLPPGGTGTVTIAGGADQCLYDMKFVIATGEEYIDQTIDLCKTGQYTINNR